MTILKGMIANGLDRSCHLNGFEVRTVVEGIVGDVVFSRNGNIGKIVQQVSVMAVEDVGEVGVGRASCCLADKRNADRGHAGARAKCAGAHVGDTVWYFNAGNLRATVKSVVLDSFHIIGNRNRRQGRALIKGSFLDYADSGTIVIDQSSPGSKQIVIDVEKSCSRSAGIDQRKGISPAMYR